MALLSSLSVQQRVVVLQVTLASTAAVRVIDMARASAITQAGSGSSSRAGIEGNARVVNGFVDFVFGMSSVISSLHIGVCLLAVLVLYRSVFVRDDAKVVRSMSRVLTTYLWTGSALAVLLLALGIYGVFFVAFLVVPITFGWWGLTMILPSILLPIRLAWINVPPEAEPVAA